MLDPTTRNLRNKSPVQRKSEVQKVDRLHFPFWTPHDCNETIKDILKPAWHFPIKFYDWYALVFSLRSGPHYRIPCDRVKKDQCFTHLLYHRWTPRITWALVRTPHSTLEGTWQRGRPGLRPRQWWVTDQVNLLHTYLSCHPQFHDSWMHDMRSPRIHPKSMDSLLEQHQAEILEDLNSLGRYSRSVELTH